MRITIDVEDDLIAFLRKARPDLSDIAIAREALRHFAAKAAASELVAMGGTMPGLKVPRRRRSKPTRAA